MNYENIQNVLKEIGQAVCEKVYASVKEQSVEKLSSIHKEGEDDTIYQIDKDVEDIIVPMLDYYAESLGGIILLAEGISEEAEGDFTLPKGRKESDCAIRIIMDPIDGTRGIMYDKRSAFFLAGAAPNKGKGTKLSDIEVAVMTELPTSRAYLSDTLWAIKSKGAHAETKNLLTGEIQLKTFYPSKKKTILGGFGQIARFFPPGREILAKIEDELIQILFPVELASGRAIIFEDQYISSGGQMYELLMGHDRFIADVRTVLYQYLAKSGTMPGHVCHPYDICTQLIGIEAGLIITDSYGNKLDAPMDLLYSVDWIGYANPNVQKQVEPVLQGLMKKYGLI
jgi:hypothetical protein